MQLSSISHRNHEGTTQYIIFTFSSLKYFFSIRKSLAIDYNVEKAGFTLKMHMIGQQTTVNGVFSWNNIPGNDVQNTGRYHPEKYQGSVCFKSLYSFYLLLWYEKWINVSYLYFPDAANINKRSDFRVKGSVQIPLQKPGPNDWKFHSLS